jgi:hypothetical protein
METIKQVTQSLGCVYAHAKCKETASTLLAHCPSACSGVMLATSKTILPGANTHDFSRQEIKNNAPTLAHQYCFFSFPDDAGLCPLLHCTCLAVELNGLSTCIGATE